MRKPKYVYCELWKINVWFCLGWPENEVTRYCKDNLNLETSFDSCDGKTIEFIDNHKHAYVIWIRDKADVPSLIHECLHVASFALSMRGWRYESDNTEPLNYLVEWLVKQALRRS